MFYVMPRKHSKKRRGRRKQKQLRKKNALWHAMSHGIAVVGGNTLAEAHRREDEIKRWDAYVPSSDEITQWVLEDAYCDSHLSFALIA